MHGDLWRCVPVVPFPLLRLFLRSAYSFHYYLFHFNRRVSPLSLLFVLSYFLLLFLSVSDSLFIVRVSAYVILGFHFFALWRTDHTTRCQGEEEEEEERRNGAGVKEGDKPRLGRRSYVQSEEARRCPSLFDRRVSLSVPQSKSNHRSNGNELTPVSRRGRCIRGLP